MKFPFVKIEDYMRSKIVESCLLQRQLDDIRAIKSLCKDIKRPTIATINGSFDLLHAGHLFMLYEASKTADILVVALNTDASIKRYKHASRPIIPLQERMEMIAALAFVDFVTWFDEDDPRCLIKLLQPDVHVNGIEYGENCIEAETVRSVGASLHLVERIPGLATSEIIKKIKDLPQ